MRPLLRYNLRIIPAILLMLAAGCTGGSPSVTPDHYLSAGPALTGQPADTPQVPSDWHDGISPEELERQWQAWLDDPGEPWTDHDPTQVNVGYRRGALLPAGYTGVIPEPGQRAADQANAVMRHLREYEPLTDAIAGRFGLAIHHQIYNDFSVWASFDVPEGVDHLKLAEDIEREFSDQVEYATFSSWGQGAWVPDDPDFEVIPRNNGGNWRPSANWGVNDCNFEPAWDATRGDPGVLIAHIDDAFLLDHEELVANYLDPEVYFPDEELNVAMKTNFVRPLGTDLPHGTWVGGILAADDNSNTIVGAAPDCHVIPLRIARSGSGLQSNADFAAALNLAIDLGARVVNASWGSGTPYAPQNDAVQRAYANDVLVVASAMNDGEFNPTKNYYPVNFENVLGVGGVGDWISQPEHEENWRPLKRCFFSNYGTYVDIAAPGVHLKTSKYDHDNPDMFNLYHDYWPGTSASCPLVAGAAALIRTARPGLSVDDVASALVSTGPFADDFPLELIRRLDAGAAMTEALSAAAVSGSVVNHLGQPLGGIQIDITGLVPVVTDPDGTFIFPEVDEGNYTVTPSYTGYMFTPASIDITVGAQDVTGVDFSGLRADLPVLGSVSAGHHQSVGLVPDGTSMFEASCSVALNQGSILKVVYTLDIDPVGQVDPYDIEVFSTEPAGGYQVSFNLATLGNRIARLSALPVHPDQTPGIGAEEDIFVFNLLGDTNGDGRVNSEDLAGFPAVLGLNTDDEGYIGYFDADLDGKITEYDAAVIGYNYWDGP